MRGAAVQLDAADGATLAAAASKILSDEPFRTDLVRRGLARAAEFSWQRTAQLTLEVYRRVRSAPANSCASSSHDRT